MGKAPVLQARVSQSHSSRAENEILPRPAALPLQSIYIAAMVTAGRALLRPVAPSRSRKLCKSLSIVPN